MAGRLEGKVAIVTGASSGIGLATAKRFAAEGASLVLAARREERLRELAQELEQSYGTKVLPVRCDVGVREDCEQLAQRAAEAFGRIDVLVNNAGIADKHLPIDLTDDEWWERVVNIDLTSCYRITKAVLAQMERQGTGSIVNISSIGALGLAGVAYSSAKAGLIGMTKNVALRYARTGIRVNAVCPGPTATELNTPEAMAGFCGEFAEECGKHIDLTLPEATVEDQAAAILFFASDESAAITGQSLTVDHGTTI